MYEERKYTFDWKGFIIKLLIVVAVLFVLYKLVPMVKVNTFNDEKYNNNLILMKDSAKSYYTVERMPKKVGNSETMTLQEMQNQKMITALTDDKGNYCDTFNSYVTITKSKDDEYLLKVQLACGDHIDYILETIGCYDVCTNNDCKVEEPKEETIKERIKITEYQFKKKITSTTTNKSCKVGYTLNDSKTTCYKTINSNYVEAQKIYYDDTEEITNSKTTSSTTEKVYTNDRSSHSYTVTGTASVCSSESSYTAWKYVGQVYSCNSSSTTKCELVGQQPIDDCNDCVGGWQYIYKKYTRSLVTTETCVCSAYYDRQVGNTCYKDITEPVCPSGYNSEYKDGKLLCYTTKNIPGTTYCENKDAVLKSDGKCHLIIEGKFKEYKCPKDDMIKDGSKCYYKTTETSKVIITTNTSTSWKYMWSTKTSISGWTKTNKTRTSYKTITKIVKSDSNEENTVIENNSNVKDKIISESNQELNQRISNNNNINSKSNTLNIILYGFIGLAFIYLLVMFVNSRKNYQN